jgi:hypothetical protein
MSRDLKAAFPATEMRAHQRDWRASIGDQAAGVVQAMQGEPELFYIYIGHSLGGLVARDVYHRMAAERQAGRRGTPPFGVIAIGTPHVGAPIAARVPQLSSVVLNALATVSGVTCGAVAAYGTGAAGLCLASARVGEFVEQQLVPVAAAASRTDMVPRSQYLNARNARPDAFTRAAIRSHAPPRWIMWRVAGDALGTCPPEAEFCNGDALAGAANVGYSSLRGLAYFFATHYMHYLALEARGAADQMDYMDMQWSIMTTQGDPNTDGIVPGASQEYPGQGLHTGPGSALRQVVIASGPSHVQEPRSRAVIAATADLLETHFRIRTFPRP